MKTFRTFAFAAAFLFALAAAASAAQSYIDLLTDDITAEANDIFDNRLAVPSADKIKIGLYRFKDFTDKYQSDATTIRKLLFGKLSMSNRLRPISLDTFDGVYDSLYPYRTIDELTQEQLIQLGKHADVDYIFSAKITFQDNRPVLEMCVFNARKGILLFTPVFPFDRTAAPSVSPAQTKPAETKPAEPKPADTKPKTDANANKETPDKETSAPLETTPDKPVFFTGAIPKYSVVDFLPVNIDNDPKPEVVFLTTSSMDVIKLNGTKASSFWGSEYKKSFPRRGLAGTIFARQSGGKTTMFVSMNVFSGSIVYQWEGGNPVRKRNLDSFIADIDPVSGGALTSQYVKGKITFSGANTAIIDSLGDNGKKYPVKPPSDYLAGCIVEYQKAAPDLSTIAVVDESGRIKVIRGGAAKPLVETEPRAGGALDCWRGPVTGNTYMLSSTLNSSKDAVLILALKKKGKDYVIDKQWSSTLFDGAITKVRFYDMNGDGRPEVLGTLEKPAGSAPKFFYVVPRFPKEDMK